MTKQHGVLKLLESGFLLNMDALDFVLKSGFLDVTASNKGYPQEMLKTVSKSVNRCLGACMKFYYRRYPDYYRRYPDFPKIVFKRRCLLIKRIC